MDESDKSEQVTLKSYKGRVPACGVFCGGCPVYVRDKKPCAGADINRFKCENCKSFHLCCLNRGITHCHQCPTFPCYRFRRFSNSWLKYGQSFLDNQRLLKEIGEEAFLENFNNKVKT